jgi:hypothetical protein
MVVLPVATPVARPPELILAMPGLVEFQVTVFVRSCLLPSVDVPVAVNCRVELVASVAFEGVIAIEARGAGTVRVVVAVIEARVAWMVVFPGAMLVASPLAEMVATAVCEEVHVTDGVKLTITPLL